MRNYFLEWLYVPFCVPTSIVWEIHVMYIIVSTWYFLFQPFSLSCTDNSSWFSFTHTCPKGYWCWIFFHVFIWHPYILFETNFLPIFNLIDDSNSSNMLQRLYFLLWIALAFWSKINWLYLLKPISGLCPVLLLCMSFTLPVSHCFLLIRKCDVSSFIFLLQNCFIYFSSFAFLYEF